MNRLLGLILFFIGIGIVIGILVTESLLVFMVAAICMLCGYHMFCH
nr:hypothetical protein [uncultured Blautia sp.]